MDDSRIKRSRSTSSINEEDDKKGKKRGRPIVLKTAEKEKIEKIEKLEKGERGEREREREREEESSGRGRGLGRGRGRGSRGGGRGRGRRMSTGETFFFPHFIF